MSGSGGFRSRVRDDRFYCPPAMRRMNQEKQQLHQQQQSKLSRAKSKSSVGSEKRVDSDDCLSSTTATTTTSLSPPQVSHLTNLDRFLEHTTPIVASQHFPKTSMRGWRNCVGDFHPYFILSDLWDTFKEWSAYGAGVPLVLNGSDSVVQYYVPYLSGIQIYVDPPLPLTKLRRPGEESDMESSRETSSDGSCEFGQDRGTNDIQGGWLQNRTNATIQGLNRLSLRNDSFLGSSIDESEISNPPGLLLFEYLERDPPFSREPLADKISALEYKFPELRTYRSCDLTPASWVSVAWYPIYRIPTGPTLQNLDACFLTFHSLSTPFRSRSADWSHLHGSTVREVQSAGMSSKLSLSTFGLATYKFKASVWNFDWVHECQRVNSLLHAADNWIRLLQVDHPDYGFFMSHNLHCR